MTNWLTMTAADLGRGIGAGEIDPVALTETYLAAIDIHPSRDLIYARTTAERALAEAHAAQTRAQLGLRRSLLDGVPISWKDLFDTAGTVTEAGSALLKDRTPTADATVLRAAAEAGLVCLGKTHMSELAFSGLGVNPITATPPNIHDPANAPGGSSSGAAASVAHGLAAIGIGSDTGGSVRVPSAWNDLVGFKTTLGALDVTGAVPLAARFDTIGPLCRSVEDAAHMFAAMAGETPVDLNGADLKGARLAVLTTAALDDLRDAPKHAFDHAVTRFRDAGAQIIEFDFPALHDALALSGILYGSEAYGTWKDVIEANPDLMFAEILARFRSGKDHSAADYVAAWHKIDQIRAQYARATAGFDAVLVPTCPNTPPNVERLRTDSAYYTTENMLTLRNTRIGNLMGLCGVSLPTGIPACGVQLMGHAGGDRHILRAAAAAEAALA